MVYLIRDVISHLESVAPPAYQESYDNSGLIVGNAGAEVKGILCSLDVTEEVVLEAKEKGCNLVVAHHPIVFKGLKSLTGKSYVERTVILAIKNDIAIYAIHTNLDHVGNGVNQKISEKIGLVNPRILAPKTGLLMKLTTFVPTENTDTVLSSLYQSGAGSIGNYAHCSFKVAGEGTFLPLEGADPYLGNAGTEERVKENRVEVVFPAYLKNQVIKALQTSHPYEEVAYYLHILENENQEIGAGMVGELPEEMEEMAFKRPFLSLIILIQCFTLKKMSSDPGIN
jgi:dinuclear metal center YbgI/SA1388 family protein